MSYRRELSEKKQRKPRKNKEFDDELFQSLCEVMCTREEMEHILGCDSRTLDKWCHRTYALSLKDAYAKFSSQGKASLRRTQFKLAKTNATMSIWLGKQLLGQKESPSTTQFSPEIAAFIDLLHQKYDRRKK